MLHARWTNRGRRSKAFEIGERHYDLGNDLYETMLDRRLVYSCACWPGAAELDEAQEAKLDLVCRKVRLKPGMRVLDIGCGWGGFAAFAAERTAHASSASPSRRSRSSSGARARPVCPSSSSSGTTVT